MLGNKGTYGLSADEFGQPITSPSPRSSAGHIQAGEHSSLRKNTATVFQNIARQLNIADLQRMTG